MVFLFSPHSPASAFLCPPDIPLQLSSFPLWQATSTSSSTLGTGLSRSYSMVSSLGGQRPRTCLCRQGRACLFLYDPCKVTQWPPCIAALQMFLLCWVLHCFHYVPSGIYLRRHQSLWLRLQFQSCKSTECLSETMTTRLPPLQLGIVICGLISVLLDPLSPRSTALWI